MCGRRRRAGRPTGWPSSHRPGRPGLRPATCRNPVATLASVGAVKSTAARGVSAPSEGRQELPADLVTARGLTKTFGAFTAVDGIDLDIHRGEAFGFLGPNGAGKTSTMRMIGCVTPVSAGTLRVLGQD